MATGHEQLLVVVGRAVADLAALIELVDCEEVPLRHSLRSNLDLQLHTLGQVEDVVRSNAPSRRVWSLGQASIPVLKSLLNGVARTDLTKAAAPSGEQIAKQVSECRSSVNDLNDALNRFAEGR